jgi:hypothetical protein
MIEVNPMSMFLRSLIAALLLIQAGAALAVTGLKFISTRGDFIGQGQRATYTPPSASVSAIGSAGYVSLSVTTATDWWFLEFAAPAGAALRRGGYADAARYPFQSPLRAGLSVSGNGRGCNTLKGWFRVLEYERDATGAVSRLAIDFVQNCEISGPPLYGSVRLNSDRPLTVPNLEAVAGADVAVVAGDVTTLDGSQSFARRGGPASYLWTQLDGPAVQLDNASAVRPTFIAPAVGIEGASLQFRLEVTDSAGRISRDRVIALVESASAPRTEIRFSGDPGDYITGGRSYTYNPSNAVISFSRNFDSGVSASINGDTWWNLDLAAPGDATLLPGIYENAQRFPFQDIDVPGLSLSGDGRGCNTLTGRFVVYQVEYDGNGQPVKLDADFEQHCEGSTPAAYGKVLLNAVPHATISRKMRSAQQRFGID